MIGRNCRWNAIGIRLKRLPIHELRALQSLRLSQTVRHVYEHVPFYRKKFDEMGLKPEDIQSIDDISKLPFTYKQDLRDNYPYGLFAVPVEDLARIHASSGTTGKQTVVGYTQNDIKIWGNCCGRALTAAGGDASDFVHVSYGYGLFTGGLGLHAGAEEIHATVIPVSSGNTKRRFRFLRILALRSFAVHPRMHCSWVKACGIWEWTNQKSA